MSALTVAAYEEMESRRDSLIQRIRDEVYDLADAVNSGEESFEDAVYEIIKVDASWGTRLLKEAAEGMEIEDSIDWMLIEREETEGNDYESWWG